MHIGVDQQMQVTLGWYEEKLDILGTLIYIYVLLFMSGGSVYQVCGYTSQQVT